MPDPYFDLWNEVKVAPKSTFADKGESDPTIEDGKYRAVIEDFQCFESKAGDLWIKWVFTVSDGLFTGRTLVRMAAPLGRRADSKQKRLEKINYTKQDLMRVLGEVPDLTGGPCALWDPVNRTTGPGVINIIGARGLGKKQAKGEKIFVNIEELVESASSRMLAAAQPVDTQPKTEASPTVLPDSFGIADPEEEIPF